MHPIHGYQMLNGVRRHRARIMFGSMRGFFAPLRNVFKSSHS